MTKAERDGLGLGITVILITLGAMILIAAFTPEPEHGIEHPALWHSTYNKHKTQCDNQYDHLSGLSCEIVDRICASVNLDLIQEDCSK